MGTESGLFWGVYDQKELFIANFSVIFFTISEIEEIVLSAIKRRVKWWKSYCAIVLFFFFCKLTLNELGLGSV